MNIIFKFFILLSISLSSIAVLATEDVHYAIIINENNIGSQLHLFEYNHDEKNQLRIKDIFSETILPGLSTHANHPELAGESLKKLLDDASIQLQSLHRNTKETTIDILGTTKMRSLPEQTQKNIYANIYNYLFNYYDFKIMNIMSISGKMEGIYTWLDVNYQEGLFDEKQETLGIIDVNDSSAQIAFEIKDINNTKDTLTIKINNQDYTVFSKQFLGLGTNEARLAIAQLPQSKNCYPTGYFSDNYKYNFENCRLAYTKLIDSYQVSSQLIPFDKTVFAVFSEAYSVYTFFGVEDASQSALESRMRYICSMSWENMKLEYADSFVPEDILSAYCANAIFLDNLFYNTYHLTYSQMWVTDKTRNQQAIDWTLGALLFKKYLQ